MGHALSKLIVRAINLDLELIGDAQNENAVDDEPLFKHLIVGQSTNDHKSLDVVHHIVALR